MKPSLGKSLPQLVQSFFGQRLQLQQHVSDHTVASYRDTFRLVFAYLQRQTGRPASQQQLADWSAENLLGFLDEVEQKRGCQPRTRNVRLAALRAFMRHVGQQEPTALLLSSQVLAIPRKRWDRPLVGFLSQPELKAIMKAPSPHTASGRRDRLLFQLLYHTGARISEILALQRHHFHWGSPVIVHFLGKGRKQRAVPLRKSLAAEVKNYWAALPVDPQTHLFVNRFGHRLSRFGAEKRLRLAVQSAVSQCPSLHNRSVSPHTLRHTTAMHLLQAGVDLNVIALLLGHESPATTHQYVELNLQMKQRCLRKLQPTKAAANRFQLSDRLLEYLENL